MTGGRLSRKQRNVLVDLRHAAEMDREPHGTLVAGATCVASGSVYVNWQTAMALERRGIAVIDWRLDEPEINLTAAASGGGEPDA